MSFRGRAVPNAFAFLVVRATCPDLGVEFAANMLHRMAFVGNLRSLPKSRGF